MIINIIGIAMLHEISVVKATASAFIVPLIIVLSIGAFASDMSLTYFNELMASRVSAIAIEASCINGHIVIDLENKRDEALSNDYIEVFVDDIDNSPFYNFGAIRPGGSNEVMGIKPDGYTTGKHIVEVRYRGSIAGAIVEC
jgi:hypothetical protein